MDETKLTDKERCWLSWFCESLNASESARRCYDCTDESARTLGHRNLQKMRPLVDERLREILPTRDQTMQRIAAVALSDVSPYVSVDGTVAIEKLIEDRKGFLLEGVTPTRYGIKWTFADRTAALRLLARYHRLVGSDVQVTLEAASTPTRKTLDDLTARVVAARELADADAGADQDDAEP